MAKTETAPQKPPTIQVRIPAGETYVDSEGGLYTVVNTADVDPLSLKIARAIGAGAAKGAILVVGNDGEVGTFSKEDFAFSGLGTLEDGAPPPPPRSSDAEVRGYRATQPRFGKWD